MRKVVIALTALIFLILSAYTASAPVWYGSGNDAGLVGRWSCEGNFNDSSGMNNHGTQSGGVKINRGVKGRACGFDGVNDWIRIPDVSSLDLKNITVSAWVKPATNTLGADNVIVAKGNYNYMLYFAGTNDNSPTFYITGLTPLSVTATTNLVVGNWYHLVGTYDSSTSNMTIYVNGVKEYTNSTIGTPTNNAFALEIGSSDNGYYRYNGSIDEVRIYNRSLSAAEINSLYNTSKSYYLTVKATPTQGIIDETGLVGYWKMDAGTGSLTDSSGQGNTLANNEAVLTNEGRFKEAYKFDGKGSVIDISSSIIPMINQTFTYSAWVKTLEPGANHRVISKYDGGGSDNGALVLDTYNNIRCLVIGSGGTSSSATSGTQLSTNWEHLACIFNGTHMSLYRNGAFISTGSAISGFAGSTNYNIQWTIGEDDTPITEFWNGSIDEVRIYNRSLSATEVANLYNGTKSQFISIKTTPELGLLNETGLVGKWSMNTNDGSNSTIAQDTSGQNNDGTVTGATFTNEGRFKEGYKFDGVNDYISLATTNLTSNFTISVWAKAQLDTAIGMLVRQDLQYALGLWSGRQLAYYARTTSGWSVPLYGSAWTKDKWYHAVVTNNGTATLLYEQGVLFNSGTQNINITNTNPLYFGTTAATGHWMNGSIDEVRIYNRSLTASEVAGLYNGTKTNFIEWKAAVG